MGIIVIIGLGPGKPRHLTVAAKRALRRGEPLYFQSGEHPVARYCMKRGVRFHSLDRYATAPRIIGRILLSAAARQSRIRYAVPGNPLDGNLAVKYLLRRAPACGHRIKIIPGVSLSPLGVNAALRDLEKIMTVLRSPRGCPWDRNQTHCSLRGCLIEEAYEVVAAIERDDDAALKEELGDLLLQVLFHSEIAREEGRFDLDAVIEGITAKLIRRHPHVFGTGRETSPAGAIVRWEQVKELEKGAGAASRIQVDPALPALLRAYKIQKRAASFGFDWPSLEGAVEKLKEEAAELKDAYRQGVPGRIEEEYGDFLFAAVNVARFLKLNPEMALGKALRKFLARFAYVSARVAGTNRPFSSFSLDQLDRWWEEAKIKGKNI